jgi:hypothetical protein
MKDGKRPKGKKEDTSKAGVMECSTVIFVPNTKSGTLVRKLREREEVMKELTGLESSSRRLVGANSETPSAWS